MRNNATNKSLAEACIRTAQSDNLLLQPLDSLLELGDLICRHGSERLAMAKVKCPFTAAAPGPLGCSKRRVHEGDV